MANRNFNPMRGEGYEIITLAGSFQPGGGTPTVNNSVSWFTVAHGATGVYTVTFADKYPSVYSANVGISYVAGGTRYTVEMNPATGSSLSELVAAGSAIPLIVYDSAGSAADPVADDANTVFFTFVMKNSTVPG